MRIASNFFMSLAGLIGLGLVLVLLMMAAGNEAAIWIGGLAFLFLGVPILFIWVMCLLAGLAFRAKPKQAKPAIVTQEKRRRLPIEKIAIGVGFLLLGYSVVEMGLAFVFGFPKLGEAVSGVGHPVTTSAIIFLAFVASDLKIPIAVGAIAFGFARLRSRRNVEQ